MASTDSMYDSFRDVLEGAVQGQVVTRFPPEPSGYLHIGHAKAALLNYHYAKIYGGKMILRFDDTNPLKEKIEFVENIQKDLKTLNIIPDQVTHTSDWFPEIQAYMEKMLDLGACYADNGTVEEMKDQRDNGIDSAHREARTPAENRKIFAGMLSGDEKILKEAWCIRAKWNMQNKFKCLRDPVFYRCKNETHHRHGDKYKAYPTYDFACPIVDSLEGITHAMRTIEYHDRNDGYYLVQKTLGLRQCVIYDYSRLNLVSTILSKRSLKWFVDEGKVDGWTDPRFPTVQGIMRRGMSVAALTKFMLEQGPSKNTNLMQWDKLWAYNKDVIDPVSARYIYITKKEQAKLILDNVEDKIRAESHPLHQKNESLGTKAVLYGKNIILEQQDASIIKVGDKVTLMKWGNVSITSSAEVDGVLTLHGTSLPDDKDFKKTTKLTWIAEDANTNFTIDICENGHLITTQQHKDEELKDIVNNESRITYEGLAEGNLRNVQQGDTIQIERRGYYYVDKVELGGQKMTLNFIPDGKQKAQGIKGKVDVAEMAGGAKDQKAEDKKAKNKQGGGTVGADGEVKLSKKDLNKLAAKQKKLDMKAGVAVVPKGKGPGAAKPKKAGPPADLPLQYNTRSKELIANLNRVEKALKKNDFMNGSQPTSLDNDEFEILKADEAQISPKNHPRVFGWYCFISKFSDARKAQWPKVEAKAAPVAAPKKAAAAEDDMDDLFGDDSDDDGAAAAAQAALKKKAEEKKKVKKVVIAKSSVMFEVKPLDDTTNLDDLFTRINKEIVMDGLVWGADMKKVPVAYGIFKLIIVCVVEDDKVSVDDVQEKIEGLDDMVQSVEIAAFNKI